MEENTQQDINSQSNPPLPLKDTGSLSSTPAPDVNTDILPKTPSPHKRLFLTLGVSSLFVILLVGFFLIRNNFLGSTQNGTNTIPTRVPIATQTADLTTGWQSHKNEDLGFEIKTPKDWIESYQKGENIFRITAPDQSTLEIIVQKSDKGLFDYLDELDNKDSTAWEGAPSKEIIKTTDTKTAGYESVMRDEKWLAAGFETKVTYLKAENTIYSFAIIPSSNNQPLFSEVNSNYNLILSTFSYLIWSDKSKWKVWNDPNGFSFKYPPSAKISHININTKITFTYGNREVVITLSQINKKDQTVLCQGVCNQKSDINISLGEQQLSVSQVWPNSTGDFTFETKIAYPEGNYDKFLLIEATYPAEARLYEINQILSTFAFKEE
jgi:hypothetical protein